MYDIIHAQLSKRVSQMNKIILISIFSFIVSFGVKGAEKIVGTFDKEDFYSLDISGADIHFSSFTLQDETPCIYLQRGAYEGGVSCNYENTKLKKEIDLLKMEISKLKNKIKE